MRRDEAIEIIDMLYILDSLLKHTNSECTVTRCYCGLEGRKDRLQKTVVIMNKEL